MTEEEVFAWRLDTGPLDRLESYFQGVMKRVETTGPDRFGDMALIEQELPRVLRLAMPLIEEAREQAMEHHSVTPSLVALIEKELP